MNTELPFDVCCNWKGFGVLRKGIKTERQKTPKLIWQSSLGAWSRICDLLEVIVEESELWWIFCLQKSTTNQEESRRCCERMIPQHASVGRVDSSRGFWRQQESAGVSNKNIWNALCPCNQGAADLKGTALSADPQISKMGKYINLFMVWGFVWRMNRTIWHRRESGDNENGIYRQIGRRRGTFRTNVRWTVRGKFRLSSRAVSAVSKLIS